MAGATRTLTFKAWFCSRPRDRSPSTSRIAQSVGLAAVTVRHPTVATYSTTRLDFGPIAKGGTE